MSEIKIFLASSSELSKDRKEFELLINRQNKRLHQHNIFLSLEIWEDFTDAIALEGIQSEYNKVARSCNIFVMLVHNKVGKYSAEEFDNALNQYRSAQKPLIYVYMKKPYTTENLNDIQTLLTFRQRLEEIKHYPVEYRTTDKLKEHFSDQINKLYIQKLPSGEQSKNREVIRDDIVDWKEICLGMLAERKQLTSNRLMHSQDTHRGLELFVDLALVQQRGVDKRSDDVLPEYGSKLYEPSRYSRSERFEFAQFLEEVVSNPTNEKLTVVGEPGSGKTTLLQKIAFWLLGKTEDLVIWVSLSELKDRPLGEYLSKEWLNDAVMYSDSQVLEDWSRQFVERRVWLLLDGLDEMLPEHRDALSLKGWVSQARVIISCRSNVWQNNPRILDGFKTYRMLEFRLSQVSSFIQKWFSQELETGERLFRSLNQKGKERIRDLVKNPLRLTLLCSTWHMREGKLPDTRAELFEQFIEDLYEWKQTQFPTTAEQRNQLNQKLGELSIEAIDREATRFRLRQDIVYQFLGNNKSKNSLLRLALDLGILNTVGVDPDNPREAIYAFFHATLQEYYAATHVRDWSFFIPKEHQEAPAESLSTDDRLTFYRIFEPQWKEVILLWLGLEDIGSVEKHNFLTKLLDFEDNCGHFYRNQAFFLAALGVSEVPDFPSASEVITRVIRYAFGYLEADNEWVMYSEWIERQARSTLLSMDEHITVKPLHVLLDETVNQRLRYEVSDVVCSINPTDRKAIDTLVGLLDSAQSDRTRILVVSSLIKHSQHLSRAEEVLVEIATSSKKERTRKDAAQLLLKLDSKHPIGSDTLVDLLEKSEDVVLVWNLGIEEIQSKSAKNVRKLLKSAYSGKNWDTRSASMWYLTELFFSRKGDIKDIPGALKFPSLVFRLLSPDTEISTDGYECIKYLAKLAQSARSNPDVKKRRQAFFSLFGFALRQPKLSMLIAKLGIATGGSEGMKEVVVELFDELNIDTNLVIPLWADLVYCLEDTRLRAMLAEAAAFSGFRSETIPKVLTHLLKETSSEETRIIRWLASALLRYDPKNQMAVNTLMDLLNRSSQDWDMCYWVLQDLSRACNENMNLTETLLNFFIETKEEGFMYAIAEESKRVFELTSLQLIVSRLRAIVDEKSEVDETLYQCASELLWHCSRKLPYTTFYKTWYHRAEVDNRLSESVSPE